MSAYEASLEKWPRRFHSLPGAARASAAAGDRSVARGFYSELADMAGESGGRGRELAEARSFPRS